MKVLGKSLVVGGFLGLLSLSLITGCTKKISDTDTTINAVLRANVKGLDPIQANDLYSGTAIQQIYEGLLQYNYLKRPYELEPLLAEAMPTASADGLTHTFKLKKGILFQDNECFPGGKGREVTAEDFIYSWKRLADPKNMSEGFWVFDGKIKGLNEWASAVKAEKADYSTPVEGLQAPDKHTLVIKLNRPYYQLYQVLAMAFTSVVPREAVDKYGKEILNHPVGTGPFILENWTRNSKIVYKRNPNYKHTTYPTAGEAGDQEKGLLADAGKALPFADRLVLNEITEDQPRWLNFMKGQLDFTEIPSDNFDQTIKDSKLVPDLVAKGLQLDVSPNADITYIAFNMKDPILGKSKGLRHAISMAQDTKTLISKFYNGRAIPAQGPIPPGFAGYDPDYKNPHNYYDVEKAKEWLKKAGYAEGKGLPELTYDTLADSKARQQAEFFQQNMAAIGVKVKVVTNSWPQFQERIKQGKAQIFGIAWGADYPDAQNFLQLFYGKNVSPGPNDAGFQNAEFDKLYETALNTPPSAKRDEMYKKLRDIVVEEAPWSFNIHRVSYRLNHGWLQNVKYNEMSNDHFKYMKVDPKKRAELSAKL